MPNQTLQDAAKREALAADAVVGDRFEVRSLVAALGSVMVYDAFDRKAQRRVGLWMIASGALLPEAIELTRASVRSAASVAHRDLVVPLGAALLPDGCLCIATEPVADTSLADLLARSTPSAPHSLGATVALVTQIAGGLIAASPGMHHGAVCPVLVRLDETGRPGLAGMGMGAALVAAGALDEAYLALEVRQGGQATEASDVYSIAAIAYAMLTGGPPAPGVTASSVVSGLPSTLDIVLESCLADDPTERMDSVASLKNALTALVAPTEQTPESEDVDIPVDFDVESPDSLPEVSAVRSTGGRARRSTVPDDLGTLLKAVTANDADRWMYAHGGLDHGPLTARELIAAISRHDALGDDSVLNMETGERRKVIDWPQYREFAETASDQRRGDERKVAARVALAEHGANSVSKVLIAVTVIVTCSALAFAYYKTLGAGSHRQHSAAEIDDLVARGQLRVQTQAIQLLPPEPPAAHVHHAGGSGGGSGGGGSYEAAMAAAIDFNFNGTVSGGTLNDAEIVRPLNASLGRFAGCLADGSARNVTLRIAIGGTGHAIGVTVNNGSGGLRSCVSGVVRSLSWRAFGGPRIGLSWGFGF